MATSSAGHAGGGIPLEEYRREVPPGWSPTDPSYPLKLFLERLKMWYRLYDGPDEAVGPLVAGRLRGRAQQIAMNLRLPDPTGHVDVGDAALVRLSVEEVRDPTTGQVVQQMIPSGVQALLNELRSAFGEAEQLQATKSLETFFEFRRGRLSLQEWSVQWQINLEEAITHAGLEINQVARTYLYLKSSGLSTKAVDDLLLQVHGDMRRFEEIRTLLLRMAHRSLDGHGGNPTLHYEEHKMDRTDDDTSSWSMVSDYWMEDPWYDSLYYEEMDPLQAWYEEGWHDGDWHGDHQDDEGWQEEAWYESGWDDLPAGEDEGIGGDGAVRDEDSFDYYKGKNKGKGSMGLGCATCGSKWHNTHSCPMGDASGKSKGNGKGFGKSGKGFGRKGFGKFGKGKGKGFGKRKGSGYGGYGHRKGFGRKGFWMDNENYMGASAMRHSKIGLSFTKEPESPVYKERTILQDSPDRTEFLHGGRRVRFDEKKEIIADDEETVVKTKKLNFPQVENAENFHMVRGRRVCGLLVDPGASSGLVGTDTLKELLESGMVPEERHQEITWGPATTTVTGISGQSDDTLARVSLPFGIGEDAVPANYTADLIGGAGSTCPALLPNTSLRQLRTVMLTQWYDNGDGVMICSTNGLRVDDPKAQLVVMKLLLSESGHYILPVNREDQQMSDNEMRRITSLWKSNADKATALEQTDMKDENDYANKTDLTGYNDKTVELQFQCQACENDFKETDHSHNDGKKQNQNQRQVADDEIPIQVMMNDNYMQEYMDVDQEYQGDVFPGHLPDGKLRYLQKMYKAVPEEFYTKTKRTPVTPRNVRSWWKKRQGNHFHFWEWCSGSGRLSLLAMLAGLCVMFPVDYRYGWDLSHPEHRRLLNEIGAEMSGPDVTFYSPSCRPWSISSTKRDLAVTQQERMNEMPTVQYIKKKINDGCKNRRGYILEQPWSSALWEHLRDKPGETHRTDQCQFNAKDEMDNPILKPTGLQSSLVLKHSLKRCKGHGGKRHGWLQGAFQGMNRTTMAAVYPEAMCKAIIKDVKNFINHKMILHENFYKCEKCAMGRAATADMEHSFIPGECRHGRWPAGENPREKKRLEEEKRQGDDIFENFRNKALKDPRVLKGKMSIHTDFALNNEQMSVLKMVLVKLLQESIDEFEALDKEKKQHDYVHWLEDPTAFSWLKKVFQDYIDVKGISAHLQPWAKPMPTPVLQLQEAPVRVLLQGDVGVWQVGRMEDLREMSASQWHEPVNVDQDWMVAIFGAEKTETSSSSSSSKAKPVKDKTDDGQEEDDLLDIFDEEEKPAEVEVVEESAIQPAQDADALVPLYDFNFKKLPKLAVSDEKMAKRLILGLHERLWHAPYLDVKNVLVRCGMPYEVWKLAADAISTCAICRKYARAHRRPQTKGTNLSRHFNDLVQIDLFKYDDSWFLLVVDEATRYKVATLCQGRELQHIFSALMRGWMRYFGPMRTLVSDQETSLMSVEAGSECQRLGITRQPAGTTTGAQGKQHSTTGLVEKHIDLTKLTMSKLKAEAERWGIEIEKEELAAEAAMAQNLTISYGGYSPTTMVFGVLPRGYLDPEGEVYGDEGQLNPTESTFERSLRLRQIALQASQAAILESRIARANRSRPQRLAVEDIQPGTTKVEIFRDDGQGHGWRGPATVLQLNAEAGTAIVEYQQRPYILPLRHVRPLRESFLCLHQDAELTSSTTTTPGKEALITETISRMKQVVEQVNPYRPYTFGEILHEKDDNYKWKKYPSEENEVAKRMLSDAKEFLNYHYDKVTLHGVKFGKGMKTMQYHDTRKEF